LIPDLGQTEIFEPICQGMTASPLARTHALLLGGSNGAVGTREEHAWDLCRQYVDRKLAGVFFAPLEFASRGDDINRRITDALDAAQIPIVLLDRTVGPYPERGPYDLVALDHRRAGYVITEHLLRSGSRRVAFVGRPNSAATVDARAAGYREALEAWDAPYERSFVHRIEPTDRARVRSLLASTRPDGIVCANDRTAAHLMHTLIGLGCEVPGDVRLVGIDDAEYSSLLPAPLTTLRQPTRQIGAAALAAMLDRVSGRDLPTRDILLHGTLVVRKSCGASGAADR
jgi:DNA-binding LacI/PurR family transcriptional regulator